MRAPPSTWKAARAAVEQMANPRIDRDAFYEAHVAFHGALVMLAVKDSIRLHLDEAMRGRSFTKVRPKILEEHRKLLMAVEKGNVKAVSALLQKHLEFYGT